MPLPLERILRCVPEPPLCVRANQRDGIAPIPDLPLVRPSRLVIEANPLKYSVMAARSLALGLLLLLCVTPVGWAAEPAGATVVLRLPASMSPDQVKGLIADLAAKGAEPAVTSVDPPSADPPPLMTGMKLTVRIWEETKQAMRAVPALRQVPQVWVRHVEAEGGTRDDALRFWAIALAGLVAAPLIGLGMPRTARSPPNCRTGVGIPPACGLHQISRRSLRPRRFLLFFSAPP